jgi:predicted CXXCH cytochrome family protein
MDRLGLLEGMEMPRRLSHRLATFAAMILGSVAIAGCANDNIVYRDRQVIGEPPPTAAANFVGYSDTLKKQTVCGNCHVDQQVRWVSTKHAKAWADLQASGHSAAACESCHAVSSLGNAVASVNVAYAATKDARYKDVQCENCHGPGLAHASTPTLSNRPLASIAVDTGTKNTNGCGECHSGTHEPFVDEWRQSAHGVASHAATAWSNADPTCKTCHTGQGALETRFGVNTFYAEKNATTPQPITCTVCHDPHGGNGIDKQLRMSVSTSNIDGNLCMKCHQRRAVPDQPNYSRNSPHSPEGETVLGYAGWFPPNMKIASGDTVIATHGSKANPRLCAGCHVVRWTVNDPATGNFAFQVTGHRFEATPCVDASGKPTGKTDCADNQKAFKGCVASGCHGSEAVARSAMGTAEARIALLTSQLDAMIAKVPKTEIVSNDGKYTTAEGAQFNSALAKVAGAPIHNPFLIEQLLTSSIQQISADYKIALPASVNLNNILSKKP